MRCKRLSLAAWCIANLLAIDQLHAQYFSAEPRINDSLKSTARSVNFDTLIHSQQIHFERDRLFVGAPILYLRGEVDEFGRLLMVPDWDGHFRATQRQKLSYWNSIPAVLIMNTYADELEVSPKQIEQYKSIIHDFVAKRLDNRFTFEDWKEQEKANAKVVDEFAGSAEEVFDKAQFKRAEQIALRFNVDQFGMLAMLTCSDFSDELEVTEEQQTELYDKAQELKAELAEEMKALQKKYDDRLMELLTPQQQRAASRDLGKPIKGLTPDVRDNWLKLDFQVPEQKKPPE